ncbi:hypothetical protein IAT38_006341 [Cryptococcus sp. DSM 104549]
MSTTAHSQPISQASLLSPSHLTPADHPTHPFSSWPSVPPHPLGRLVLLTPSITLAAAKSSLQTGQRFGLDWSIYPSGARMYARAHGRHWCERVDDGPRTEAEAKEKGEVWHPCFDDFLEFNTQSSTQWDYFLHYSYPGSGLFYSGLTEDKITKQDTGDIGVAAIAEAGGVQTRAILLDIPLYLSRHSLPVNPPLSNPPLTRITLSLILSALEYFHLTPQVGDVLLVRTGFEELLAEDKELVQSEKREKSAINETWWGVEGSEEVARWIWETGFVGVGSDNPTFESWPGTLSPLELHPVLLSGMGIPICELLRLSDVARECERLERWHFFFSSTPLRMEHGVASPPNAVAIF